MLDVELGAITPAGSELGDAVEALAIARACLEACGSARCMPADGSAR